MGSKALWKTPQSRRSRGTNKMHDERWKGRWESPESIRRQRVYKAGYSLWLPRKILISRLMLKWVYEKTYPTIIALAKIRLVVLPSIANLPCRIIVGLLEESVDPPDICPCTGKCDTIAASVWFGLVEGEVFGLFDLRLRARVFSAHGTWVPRSRSQFLRVSRVMSRV